MSHLFDYRREVVYTEDMGPMDWRGRVYPAPSLDAEDVLNQEDTISLEDLEADEHSEFSAAGFDEQTPVDTFIRMNGDNRYVTEI